MFWCDERVTADARYAKNFFLFQSSPWPLPWRRCFSKANAKVWQLFEPRKYFNIILR